MKPPEQEAQRSRSRRFSAWLLDKAVKLCTKSTGGPDESHLAWVQNAGQGPAWTCKEMVTVRGAASEEGNEVCGGRSRANDRDDRFALSIFFDRIDPRKQRLEGHYLVTLTPEDGSAMPMKISDGFSLRMNKPASFDTPFDNVGTFKLKLMETGSVEGKDYAEVLVTREYKPEQP